ncbi:hypothetical protein O6H91_04G056100 [Diphasiastrum complanatum]|uniref:Uncharacterized protein n=1 Tax=Diphasiastrum complanatum TaxID=34168 RepID=A0ACC2DXQ8_DIPCM|nr:hypothetical protein O6H91_04G056100 [Diphasiastrum complanatum]
MQSLHEVLLLVQRSLQNLCGSNSEYEASEHVAMLRSLSDTELGRAIPFILKSLNITTLHSLSFIVSGRSLKSKDRMWLERKLKAEIMALLEQDGEILFGLILKASLLIRNPKSERKMLSSAYLSEVPFSPREAIQGALQQLNVMPLRSLHAMNDILSKRISMAITGRLSKLGDNKPKLVRAVGRKVNLLLKRMKGDSIPEHLQKALRVMSLSAREKHGCDGNLARYVGPVPAELEVVHRRLISALSLTRKLNFHQLENIYTSILGKSKRIFKKRHPRFYLRSIQIILREVLYRCDSNDVPEPVQTAVEMIHMEAKVNPDFEFENAVEMIHRENPDFESNLEYPGKSKRQRLNEQHCETEKEALLNVSCYLQQVLWEVYENCSADKMLGGLVAHEFDTFGESTGERSLAELRQVHMPESEFPKQYTVCCGEPKYEECLDDNDTGPLNKVSTILVAKGGDASDFSRIQASETTKNICSESVVLERMDFLAEKFKRIADQGAALVYVIVGRAMEEAFRRQGGYLPENTRRYLRTGNLNSKNDPEEHVGASENFGKYCDEEALILSIVEKLPIMSTRVLEKVKAGLSRI